MDKKQAVEKKKTINSENISKRDVQLQKGTDFIHSIIHEYLMKKEYFKTLDVFQEDIGDKIKSNSYLSNAKQDETLGESLLLQYLNSGKKNEFFKLWNRIIPNHIKLREEQLQKFEFFAQIYFAVYPILPNIIGDMKNIKETHLKDMKARMKEFRAFLDTKEVELSKTTDFLAYYALPYVEHPRNHPSFKHIFTTEWVNDLKVKLKSSLKSFIPSGKNTLIYDLYLNFVDNNSENKMKNDNIVQNITNISNKNDSVSQERFQKLSEDYVKLKKKEETAKVTLIECQKKWTNFSLEIINSSLGLINQIVKSKSSKEFPNELLESVNNKLKKYDTFLRKNAEELEKNTSILNSKENSYSSSYNRVNEENEENLKPSDSKQENLNYSEDIKPSKILENQNLINFNTITSLLKSYAEPDKINFVLREIRNRISKKKYYKSKNVTLYSILYYDVFGLKNEKITSLIELLKNEECSLETLKLLNAIANEKVGRSYLLVKSQLVEEIVKIMMKEEGDTEKRQCCLGIIQKFTLRSDPQKLLIDLDVIMWITSILISELNYISDYTLEYGLALLMNLSLRTSGRDKCETVSKHILKILCNYLDHESLQVRTIINGTLYSLLKRKKFREEAKSIGLENVLTYNIKTSNDQMKKQIQYILEEMNSNKYDESEQDEKYDEEIDDEVIEDEEVYEEDMFEEESINEEQIALHNDIIKEFTINNQAQNTKEMNKITEYIRNKYNSGGEITKVNKSNTSMLRKDELDRPLRRPTTPMTNLNNTGNSQIFNVMGDKRHSFLKNKNNVSNNTTHNQFLNKENQNNNSVIEKKENNEKDKDKEQEVKKFDYEKAFKSREKIVRTPPNINKF